MMLNFILDERWETRLFPPGVLFHLSHLGSEFRVLCFLTSVPNRVWDAMGSPCLTFQDPNSSSGGPSWFYHLKPMCVSGLRSSSFKTTWASEDSCPLLVHPWK